jgi:hypothetical protein
MSSNILIGNKAIDEGKKKGAIDGKNSVISNPAAYNLYTQKQMDAIGSYDTGKKVGAGEIISDPAAYNLYTKYQYESHSKPHKVRIYAKWTSTPTIGHTDAHYNSDIKVDDHSIDGVGKDIDGRDLGNFYKRDSNLRGPYNDYFTVPYNPFLQ